MKSTVSILKWLTILYTLMFITPLFFILWLSNDWYFIVLKILLALWMLSCLRYLFYMSESIGAGLLTLGPFVVFQGLFFTIIFFSHYKILNFIFFVLGFMLFKSKFWQIEKIVKEAEKTI